jgi:hypothetical protein
VPGQYCGTDTAANLACFQTDVSGSFVTDIWFVASVACTDGSTWTWSMHQGGSYAISPSANAFLVNYSGPGTSGIVSNLNYSLTFGGSLTTYGSAAGAAQLSHISWDENGMHYDCSGSVTNWTALHQAVPIADAWLSSSQNGPRSNTFSLSGGPVYLNLNLDSFSGDHLLHTAWIDPQGRTEFSGDHPIPAGTSNYSVYANIPGTGITGTWSVRYSIDGVLRGQIYFIVTQ